MKKDDKAYVIINSSQMKETLSAFGHNEKISNKISKNSFKSIKKKFGLLKTYDKYQSIIK